MSRKQFKSNFFIFITVISLLLFVIGTVNQLMGRNIVYPDVETSIVPVETSMI